MRGNRFSRPSLHERLLETVEAELAGLGCTVTGTMRERLVADLESVLQETSADSTPPAVWLREVEYA